MLAHLKSSHPGIRVSTHFDAEIVTLKVFFLVIVLGLFHGLVLLPVILSLVGPSPYRHYTQAPTQEPEKSTDSTFKGGKQSEVKESFSIL